MFHVPEHLRVCTGPYASDPSYGNNGKFQLLLASHILSMIASDGGGWEHVSASFGHRCPTWPEMCIVKNLFWDREDTVLQFHPPESQYVNCHPYCLHLWRETNVIVRLPPSHYVGPR